MLCMCLLALIQLRLNWVAAFVCTGLAAAPGSRGPAVFLACCAGRSFCLAARCAGLIAAPRGKQVMGAGVESPRYGMLGGVYKGRASLSVSAGASSARV